MAKGIIKDIKSSSKVPTTGVGTLTDNTNRLDYPFEQTFYESLGLKAGTAVDYNLAQTPNGQMALLAAPAGSSSGVIKVVNGDNTTGTIVNARTGSLSFSQSYAKQAGLSAGVNATYIDSTVGGKPMALCVSPVSSGK